MRRSPSLLVSLALSAALLPAAGCELVGDLQQALDDFYNEPIELRINLESPPKEVDVTEQVTGVEDGLCDDEDSESCLILRELDRSDDGEVESPDPRIPDEFPATVTIEDDMGNAVPDPDEPCDPQMPRSDTNCPPWEVTVDEFLESSGVYDEIDIKQAIPIDLSDEVEVSTPDAIKSVAIESLGVKYIDNGLTFDTVPLDLYMTLDYYEEPDADELLGSGELTYLGQINAQSALTDGKSDIEFIDEETRDLFRDGLLKLKFTLVFAVPEGTEWTLADSPDTPDHKLKPQGATKLSLVATLIFTVTPRELAGDARAAYEERSAEIQQEGGFEL